jgi:REP element-mobilizing transposase RayT
MRAVTENRAKNYRSTRIMQGQRIRALIAVSSYLFRHIVLRYVYPIRSSHGAQILSPSVLLLKANSLKWMTEAGNEFSWQEGYGAFSVSSSSTDALIQYIKNQEKHHRKFSFEEEFRAILQRHGLEQDVRHLPD